MVAIKGRVFTGDGKASEFLSLGPYREFLEEVLGQEVFPGTLNLEVESERIEEIKQKAGGERLDSFEHEGEQYGGISIYSVIIEGVEAGLLEIDRTLYEEDVAEIVASEELRDKIGLKDGDLVEVSARKKF